LLDEDDLETCRKSTNIKNAFDRIEILWICFLITWIYRLIDYLRVPFTSKMTILITQINRYDYPYLPIILDTVIRHHIRQYTCCNLIMIGPYFCARYYSRIRTVYAPQSNRIRTVSFDLSNIDTRNTNEMRITTFALPSFSLYPIRTRILSS
jgi:hypothetical protein